MKTFEKLVPFLITARAKTYASGGGKVTAVLDYSTQLEYREGDWLYRDVYYTGENTFFGMETVFCKDRPIFGMSYYGNWGDMTEKEIDQILRGALGLNPETRLYKEVVWKGGEYVYICDPDVNEGIKEIGGTERITKNGQQVYIFYYAGSVLTTNNSL